MRLRLSGNMPNDPDKMVAWLREHRRRILSILRKNRNVSLLEVDYAALLANPRAQVKRIAVFAKIDNDKIDKMVAVVDPTLRHFTAASAEQASAQR
jgi:hypothetical protein